MAGSTPSQAAVCRKGGSTDVTEYGGEYLEKAKHHYL